MDMEQKDYDSRTALHVAAAEGIFLVLDFLDMVSFYSTSSLGTHFVHEAESEAEEAEAEAGRTL